MSDSLFMQNQKLIRPRVKVASPLVFNIPEAALLRLNNISNEDVLVEKFEEIPVEPQTQLITLELESVEAEHELTLELETVQEVKLDHPLPVEIKEEKTKVVPFFELRLQNPEAVYKVGHSFLSDIEKGKKHFGFASHVKHGSESMLLVYASFIQHSLKKPVLVVAKDMASSDFDNHRMKFEEGQLLNWKTWEWGDLCFVDHKQLISTEKEFAKTELEFIHNHFSAVLWSLPTCNTNDRFQQVFLSVLGKLNSITMVVEKGATESKAINKTAEYYNCFNVPVKGVLFG